MSPTADRVHAEAAQRFPLSWPQGWGRTPNGERRRANFGTKRSGEYKRAMTIATAVDRLQVELTRARAEREILSTNVRLRLDGLPYSDNGEVSDPGAAVYFWLAGQPRVLACDKWTRVADNIAAIAAHMESIRAIDRYGVGTREQAYAGYCALPPDAATDWWIVLGVTPQASPAEIDRAFRDKARTAHPDVGGDHDTMARLTAARAAAIGGRG